jgi:hypothetical protein
LVFHGALHFIPMLIFFGAVGVKSLVSSSMRPSCRKRARRHRLRRCRHFNAALRQAHFSLARRVSTSDRRLMARDEDDSRIRPGKVRDRDNARTSARRIGGMRRRPASFLGEVHQAIRWIRFSVYTALSQTNRSAATRRMGSATQRPAAFGHINAEIRYGRLAVSRIQVEQSIPRKSSTPIMQRLRMVYA